MELDLLRAGYSLPRAVFAGLKRQAQMIKEANEQGRLLTSASFPFECGSPTPRARILVLGDSTGLGVGADIPERSLAGLIAADFDDMVIVNTCQAGARMADLIEQVRNYAWWQAPFDLILLHIGGNDIVNITPLRALGTQARELLGLLSDKARQVVWLGPPNIGTLPLFEPPLAWWMTKRSRKACRIFAEAAAQGGAEFVNFFREREDDHCASDPDRYFAADRFHPSTAYYRYGYQVLVEDVPLHTWLGAPQPKRQGRRRALATAGIAPIAEAA